MNLNAVIQTWGIGLSVILPILLSGRAKAEDRPNILWITTEDISPDLGCYGNTEARTPNIDRLASQGLLFRRAFSVAGVCAPSRSGIITGMYPTSIGTHHMRSQGVPPAGVKCFPEYLRAAGYFCTNNSKTDYNFDAPLTAWDENSGKAHWRNRKAGQPFFAVFNITTTHESKVRAAPAEFKKLTEKLTPDERHAPSDSKLPPYYPDTPLTRKDWAQYNDLITAMDKQVAELLEQLAADGLAENTVVFFYGDHGRGLPRGKRWVYDSGIRAPLVVRWPGKIKPGEVEEELVSFVDLAPTVLSIAGIHVPKAMQGRAFLGDQKAAARDYIFAARDRMDETYDIIRCVRDKRFKYIRNFEPQKPYAQPIAYMDEMPTMREWRRLAAEGKLTGPQKLFFQPTKPVEELYDTEADPHEIQNLADLPERQADLARLRKTLETWMRETQDLALVPESELNQRVRPQGKWSVTATPSVSPRPGDFGGPLFVRIDCATEGASIAYSLDEGKNPRWHLYSAEIPLAATATLRFKACRLGYRDSPESVAQYNIAAGASDTKPESTKEPAFQGRTENSWREQLKDQRQLARLEAVRALAAMGPGAVPALIEALKHPDAAVERWAAVALGDCGLPAAESALLPLKDALQHQNSDVRVSAAQALWKLNRSADVSSVLIAALKDPSPKIRLFATQVLAEIGPAAKDALPALKLGLDDSDDYVRRSSARTIDSIQADSDPASKKR